MNDFVKPNFEDERTLLTAQRVVPLQKIEARTRHRRRWFLGGAFTLATMLGAGTGLIASYLKVRNAPQTVNESSVVPDIAAPVAVAASSPVDAPVVETETPEETTTPVTPPKRNSSKHTVVAVRPNPEADDQPNTRNMSEHDQLNQIRDAVLYDEWQERRARRALRRERQRPDRYNHRDLSNLNEIFEGPRRRP